MSLYSASEAISLAVWTPWAHSQGSVECLESSRGQLIAMMRFLADVSHISPHMTGGLVIDQVHVVRRHS